MGLLTKLKKNISGFATNIENQKQIDKLNSLFRAVNEVANTLEEHTPEQVAQKGITKDIFQSISSILQDLEHTIYGSLIYSFCISIENTLQKDTTTNEEKKQIEPLIYKYQEPSNNKIKPLKGEYEEFLKDLEMFSDKYPKWVSDGTRLINIQRKIEELVNLNEQEEQLKSVKQRLENYARQLHQEEELLTETNFIVLSPYEFEQYIANLFKSLGYKTLLTSPTKDMGVDVFATKGDERVAIQVKRYQHGNNVGNEVVQKLLGAMQQKSFKANKGIIITTSDFTEYAIRQAEETPVELWDGKKLKEVIKTLKYNS